MNTSILILLQILLALGLLILYFMIYFGIATLIIKLINKLSGKKICSRKLSTIFSVLLVIITVVAGYLNMQHIERYNQTIYTEHDLSGNDNNYKIILISDVHYCPTSSKDSITELCEKVNHEEADIILLLGDIVDDNSTRSEMESIFNKLGKLKNNYGIYFIYGNHDLQLLKNNNSRAYTQDELESTIINNNIHILQDSSVEINDDITLIGREDYSIGKRKTLNELVPNDSDNYILLMDHKPAEYNKCKDLGIDLQVSGHTHNGQVFPLNIILDIFGTNELMYGTYEDENTDFKAIVTAGVGGWALPIRNAAPSEYVVINLISKEQ